MEMRRAPAMALAALLLAPHVSAQTLDAVPAEGFWYDPARPGTGFSLELRGQTVAMAFYHFEAGSGSPLWHLAVGPLESGVVQAPLQALRDGSCLGCLPFRAADVPAPEGSVRLTLTSAREAMLQVNDGAAVRVVALPYGVPYVSDAAGSPHVPLPDLRGTWVIGSPDGNNPYVWLQLDTAQHVAGTDTATTTFTGTAIGSARGPAVVECSSAPPECHLLISDSNGFDLAAVFAIGHIDEERAIGHATGGSVDGRGLVAWRVATAEGQP